jgi:hypothetical protein
MNNGFKIEIARLKHQLFEIRELNKTLKTPGWINVLQVFQDKIGQFIQYAYDNCDKDRYTMFGRRDINHDIEIKARKLTAEALGDIMKELDARVVNEKFVTEQLYEKSTKQMELEDTMRVRKL